MGVKFADNAVTTLAAAATSIDTTLTVTDGSLFPELGASDYFYATLVSTSGTREIVKVTGRVDETFTVVRGQGGTIALPFAANSRIELRVTAVGLRAMYDEIVALI